jgi:hypothetical protein
MDNIDDYSLILILSYVPIEDLRKVYKTSIRIFRTVIGNACLRYKLYVSWEDSVKANDIQALNYFAKLYLIPEKVMKFNVDIKNKNTSIAKMCLTNKCVLKCLHENGYAWSKRTCPAIAAYGSLECLKYAHEHGCPWNPTYVGDIAITCGSLECLKYAHENGCMWGAYTFDEPEQCESLECMRYAHEHGCPWCDFTCANAAVRCSLECLQYAHENGCAIDMITCIDAITYGSLDCVKYAIAQTSEFNGQDCLKEAIKCGRHEITGYIRTLIARCMHV